MDKKKVLIIPDGSLWYLPFSLLLDAEDRPFGADKVPSLIPSAASLKFLRSVTGASPVRPASRSCSCSKSVPQAAADGSEEEPSPQDRSKPGAAILKDQVCLKSTHAALKIQQLFDKFEIYTGPTATVDRFRQAGARKRDVTVLALPLAVTDEILGAVQPWMFFSPPRSEVPGVCW